MHMVTIETLRHIAYDNKNNNNSIYLLVLAFAALFDIARFPMGRPKRKHNDDTDDNARRRTIFR